MNYFFDSIQLISDIPWWISTFFLCIAVIIFFRSLRGQMKEVAPLPRYTIAILRVIILILIFLFVLRPALPKVTDAQKQGTPQLLCFLDASHSMTRADCGMGPITRFELFRQAAQKLIEKSQGYKTRTLYFNSDICPPPSENNVKNAALTSTDLTTPLKYLLSQRIPKHSQAVIFSDGTHTAPVSLKQTCAEYAAAGNTSVNTIGMHPVEDIPRIAITNLTLPAQCWQEDTVQCTADIISDNLYDDILVTLLRDEQQINARTISYTTSAQRVTFQMTPKDHGLHTYTVEATSSGAENATATAALHVSRRNYKVLYIEGTAVSMYDNSVVYKNVPNALNESDDIDCEIMVDPDVYRFYSKATEPLINDPHDGYPLTLEGLGKYDVIINSDIRRSRFSENQINNTAEFVEKRGGGYVMIGGDTAYGRGGWNETRIDRISPVDMGYERYMDGPFVWEFTQEGFRHPILQISDDPRENRDILKSMPPFYGYNSNLRIKPNAVLLATHPVRLTDEQKKMPMLAVQEMGRGRCMAFMTDTTWLWGQDFEKHWGEPRNSETYQRDNRYYKKFWQNSVRWLGRNSLRHYYSTRYIVPDKSFYQVGDTAKIEYNDPGAFLAKKHPGVTLVIQEPNGEETKHSMIPVPSHDMYITDIELTHTGRLSCTTIRSDDKKNPASFYLYVHPFIKELFDIQPQNTTLEHIAKAGHGKTAMYDNLFSLPPPPEVDPLSTRNENFSDIWTNTWVIIIILLLCTAEWLLRRSVGMA